MPEPDQPIQIAAEQFYNPLAADYHLLFADWPASVRRQGDVLDRLIRRYLDRAPLTILDASCGIGTQALGLARRGHRVHASDLSPAAVARARAEAAKLGVPLTCQVADLRALAQQVDGTFDAVISCDNSLPHLLTMDDLRLAAQNLWAKVREGGLFLASIRDYDAILAERPRADLPRVVDDADGRRITFQVWDWAEAAPLYTVHQFIVRQVPGPGDQWRTTRQAGTYRALTRAELSALLAEAGFSEIEWHRPESSGFYQPIVTARRVGPTPRPPPRRGEGAS